MQLLTASKLSTVAMLAMAAVLHFSVSAVPMEQPGAAQGMVPAVEAAVPAAKAPADPFETLKSGEPSERVIKELFDIYTVRAPASLAEREPIPSEDPQNSFDRLSNELLQEVVSHVDNTNDKHSLALTGHRQFNAVQDQSLRQARRLKKVLDALWSQSRAQLKTEGMDGDDLANVMAATSAWEEPLQKALGLSELADCPYELLPYAFEEPFEEPFESEQDILQFWNDSFDLYAQHLNRNICRLAVNRGYFWLMKIATTYQHTHHGRIFSVVSQLRLFSQDKALVSDLDKILAMLIAVARADELPVRIVDDIKYLLVLSIPSVIPILDEEAFDPKFALLLLLTFNRYQSSQDNQHQPSQVNIYNPLDIVKLGDVNEFIQNMKPYLREQITFKEYSRTLFNSMIETEETRDDTQRNAVNILLDYGSSAFLFEEHNDQVHKIYVFDDLVAYPTVVELLADVLELDQFTKLYDELYKTDKNPALIVMAGRSRKGPEYMKYVFADIFGAEKTAIDQSIQVDSEAINAEHLAQLAQNCAIACTTDNWKVFAWLLAGKIHATPRLSYVNSQSAPATASLADQVASEMDAFYVRAEFSLEHKHGNADDKTFFESALEDMGEMKARLQEFVRLLSRPPSEDQGPAKRSKRTLEDTVHG